MPNPKWLPARNLVPYVKDRQSNCFIHDVVHLYGEERDLGLNRNQTELTNHAFWPIVRNYQLG